MREFLAGVAIAFASLFGSGEPAQPQPASLTQPASAIVALAEAAESQNSVASSATTTIINQYITQPVIEREVLAQNAITREELDASLAALRSDLLSVISSNLPRAYTIASAAPVVPVSITTFAHSQKIDQLANVSISNATVSGVTGLTDSDIPDTITASNYLPLTGGALSGALSLPSGFLSLASSTIGAGTQTTGLTISGGATTTGNHVVTGSLTVGTGNATGGLYWPTSAANTSFRAYTGGNTYNGVFDPSYYFGYNLGKASTTEPILQMDMEGHYVDGSGDHWMEMNLDYVNAAGDPAIRFFGMQVDRENDEARWAYAGTFFRIESAMNNENFKFVPTGTKKTQFVYNGTGNANLVIGGNADVTAADKFILGPDALANENHGITLAKGGLNGINKSTPLYPLDLVGSLNIDSSSNFLQAGSPILSASSTNYSTLVGLAAPWMTSTSTVLRNTAIGYGALNTTPTNAGAADNVAIGSYSLYSNTTGSQNTAVGSSALNGGTSGYANTAIGRSAAQLTTTGYDNAALGRRALYSNTTGANNVAVGSYAFANNTAANNGIAIGYQAAYGASGTYSNSGVTAVGYKSGNSLQNGSDFNTLLGHQSGYGITTGSNNIWIGTATSSTGVANLTTGSQNILIGNNISLPSATGNGQLNIGNIIYGTGITSTGSTLSSGLIGVATTSPWRTLSVTGTVGFDGLTGSTGAGSLCLTANKEVVYNSGSDACLPSLRETKHDISALSLDALQIVDALDPVSFVYNEGDGRVRYGFIAEDTAAVDSHLVSYSASGTLSGIDDRSIISIAVKAIQELGAKIASILDRLSGHDAQIAALEARLAALETSQGAAVSQSQSDGSIATPDTEPPTITINGNNPAQLQVGDTYADLGATVTDNVDLNLGLHVFVGSTPMDQAVLDTSEPNERHIHYVATDSAGNTATSTRTVIVGAPSIVPADTPEETRDESQPVEAGLVQ